MAPASAARRVLVLLALAVPGAAPAQGPAAPGDAGSATGVSDTAAALRWNVLARRLYAHADSARRPARAAAAAGDSGALRRFGALGYPQRLMTVLSVAQYDAAVAAPPAERAAAVGEASAVVLAALLADSDARAVVARARADGRGGEARLVAGRPSLGERVAARVLAWAEGDRHDARWTGVVPVGAGMWRSRPDAPPGNAAWTLWRPWALDSVSQLRPAPPPEYGSPAFEAALDEVRRVARTRTSEQARIARWWADHQPYAVWNAAAVDALVRRRAGDVEAARALALVNVAVLDAGLACWDAKYLYWLLRPSQADDAITFPAGVPLPNFPSYPSGHAAAAGAASTVIGALLPEARDGAERLAEEGAVSRLYAGVHYRFDNDTGLALGRRVARHVLAVDARGALTDAAPWRAPADSAAASRSHP